MRENWRLPNPPVFLLSLRSSLFDPFLPFLAVLTFFLDSLIKFGILCGIFILELAR
jgi:hypothetical protein